MATERRYLKGDTVQVVEFPERTHIGQRFRVVEQYVRNGVVAGHRVDYIATLGKLYAHQVKLVKRPWWNWLRLPFAGKVVVYQRSTARP